MNSEADKLAINLRYNMYKHVRVTDDHTSNEQELIKNMVVIVKEANGKEPTDFKYV